MRGALGFRALLRDGCEGGLEHGQSREQQVELLFDGGGQQVAFGFGGQQAFALLGGEPVRRLRRAGAGEGDDLLAQDGVAVGARAGVRRVRVRRNRICFRRDRPAVSVALFGVCRVQSSGSRGWGVVTTFPWDEERHLVKVKDGAAVETIIPHRWPQRFVQPDKWSIIELRELNLHPRRRIWSAVRSTRKASRELLLGSQEQEMPLIERNHLLQRLGECLAEATHVDIAVAWATPCDALEALAERARRGTAIRIAVGVSGNVTIPTTLRRLQCFADLRIAPSSLQPGIFHPKYFRFRGPDRTICWIGSANLTRGGFGENYELIHEFDDSAGEGQHWFESLWNTLDPDPDTAIGKYEAGYQPPQRDPRPPLQGGIPDPVPLAERSTWDDFVEQLRALDDYWNRRSEGRWNVLGDTHSWLHTIATGREVVRLPDWANLTQRECYILRGFGQEEGGWGLLGTLKPARRVASVFKHEHEHMPDVRPIRMQLRGYVNQVLNSNYGEIAQDAHAAVQKIMENKKELKGFGAAAATRLLTLARPDCLVSVNGQSAAGLGNLSDLPMERDPLAMRYEELLNWVYEQPWFNAPQPDDPLERMIWHSRTALLDAFVYEGTDV